MSADHAERGPQAPLQPRPDQTPEGLGVQSMEGYVAAFEKVAPRAPDPPPSPTGFGKPRRRR